MSDISVYVVDSSVFNKLYLDEPDRDKALTLFTQSAYREIALIAPTLLFYEVIHTSQYYQLPVQQIMVLLKKQEQRNLHLIEPTLQHTEKALDIIQMGHPKSGYPSIYDSIFHAMAIVEQGTLITADKRHYEKTKHLSHIQLLKDYS